jgi:hypothetical protein
MTESADSCNGMRIEKEEEDYSKLVESRLSRWQLKYKECGQTRVYYSPNDLEDIFFNTVYNLQTHKDRKRAPMYETIFISSCSFGWPPKYAPFVLALFDEKERQNEICRADKFILLTLVNAAGPLSYMSVS